LAAAVRAITEGRPPEQIAYALGEIEGELEHPTQTVHSMLPGAARSEEECRAFLLSVVGEFKSRPRRDA
jgi:hypothetical protein